MKHTQIVTAGITIIGLLMAGGCSCSQVAVKQIIFSPIKTNEIKAMTFNVRVDTPLDVFNRWPQRKEAVIDTIADHAADVVGLQETLNHQVTDISRSLPQYSYYSVGRNDGQLDGESCAIFFRRSRYTLRDSGTFWFSDAPDKPGSKGWGNLWPRICSWVRLEQIDTGRCFYVYNVHLACLSQQSRERSVCLLTEKIARRKNADPFIVMGDFNMKLNNPAMKYLHEAGRINPRVQMQDAWLSLNPKSSGTGTKIDHIPLSRELRALDISIDKRKVNGRHPSDHFPVIASIQISQPAYTKADIRNSAKQSPEKLL